MAPVRLAAAHMSAAMSLSPTALLLFVPGCPSSACRFSLLLQPFCCLGD
jgi:hypothetical protein